MGAIACWCCGLAIGAMATGGGVSARPSGAPSPVVIVLIPCWSAGHVALADLRLTRRCLGLGDVVQGGLGRLPLAALHQS